MREEKRLGAFSKKWEEVCRRFVRHKELWDKSVEVVAGRRKVIHDTKELAGFVHVLRTPSKAETIRSLSVYCLHAVW